VYVLSFKVAGLVAACHDSKTGPALAVLPVDLLLGSGATLTASDLLRSSFVTSTSNCLVLSTSPTAVARSRLLACAPLAVPQPSIPFTDPFTHVLQFLLSSVSLVGELACLPVNISYGKRNFFVRRLVGLCDKLSDASCSSSDRAIQAASGDILRYDKQARQKTFVACLKHLVGELARAYKLAEGSPTRRIQALRRLQVCVCVCACVFITVACFHRM